MLDVEVTLSDWVFDAIENDHVLTLSRQYFFLRKPLERRLYELARKHCGAQPKWTIGLELLRDKCGSGSTLKEFRRLVGKVIADDAAHGHMPDYAFALEGDLLLVRPKRSAPTMALGLAPDTHEAARALTSGWDVRVLEAEWRDWVTTKGIAVQDPDRHFLGFCKRRGPLR